MIQAAKYYYYKSVYPDGFCGGYAFYKVNKVLKSTKDETWFEGASIHILPEQNSEKASFKINPSNNFRMINNNLTEITREEFLDEIDKLKEQIFEIFEK